MTLPPTNLEPPRKTWLGLFAFKAGTLRILDRSSPKGPSTCVRMKLKGLNGTKFIRYLDPQDRMGLWGSQRTEPHEERMPLFINRFNLWNNSGTRLGSRSLRLTIQVPRAFGGRRDELGTFKCPD